MCAYRYECIKYCIVYKITCKILNTVYDGNNQETQKITEQQFQGVYQKGTVR